MKKIVFTGFVLAAAVLNIFITITGAQEKMPQNPIYIIKTSLGDIHVELYEHDAPETVNNFIGLAEGTKEFVDIKTEKKVKRPFYDDLIFHRVIKDFMIQGGCPLGTGTGGPGYKFADEINASALGLDKIKAVDPESGPNPLLMINNQEKFQRFVLAPIYDELKITSQEELDKRKEEVNAKLFSLTVKDFFVNMGYSYSEKGSPYFPKRGALAMANSGPNTNGSQFFINLIDTDWLKGKHTVFGKVVKGMKIVDKIGAVNVDASSKPVDDVKILSIRKKQ